MPWRRIYQAFAQAQIGLYAAALAYYALLGIFPLLTLAAGVGGLLLAKNPELSAAFAHALTDLIPRLFPTAEGLAAQVVNALQQGAASITLGSLLILLWTASHLFTALAEVLSQLINGRGAGLVSRIRGLLGPAVFGLAMILVSVLGIALGFLLHFLPDGPWNAYAGLLIAYLSSAALLFFLYRFLPVPPPKTPHALFAALLAAAGWNLIAWGLPRFLPKNQYALVYGPLAGPVLLLLGFYLLMWILLAGAVIVGLLNRVEPREEEDVLGP